MCAGPFEGKARSFKKDREPCWDGAPRRWRLRCASRRSRSSDSWMLQSARNRYGFSLQSYGCSHESISPLFQGPRRRNCAHFGPTDCSALTRADCLTYTVIPARLESSWLISSRGMLVGFALPTSSGSSPTIELRPMPPRPTSKTRSSNKPTPCGAHTPVREG